MGKERIRGELLNKAQYFAIEKSAKGRKPRKKGRCLITAEHC